MQSVLHALISSNEQLGQRAEHFAQLLVEHDKTLDALFDQLGKTVPEIRKEIDARLVNAVPGLVSEAYSKYNEELDARCRAAVSESQGKLESVRAEIVAMAAAQFTEAEKQIGVTAEQIEARILGALTGAATERIEKLERGLVIEIQHAINAALPKQEFAAAPTLIDSYRGQWREGMVAQRGDLFSWYGSTYLALEDTNDTPGRKNIGREGAKWAVIAARGAGGGGGTGGDSLPSQTGNAGKFLKTDGTSTLWETIPGGGDMLGANNLTDVASTTAAFANIKQDATTTASGVVTFATSGESAALKAVQANDARLSDSRTPTAHASTHQTGGSDPIDFPVDSVFGAINTITQVDYLALNVSSTVAVTTAKIVWNATETTGELGFNASVNTLLGMDVHAQVYNQSGSPFTKGQVVRVDGSSGTRLKASLALATSDANSAQTFGLCAQTIGNNGSGVIITQGLLRAIDTNAYNTGDTLWLSATTPGAMVNVRPVAPYHGVRVGYVVKKAGSADGIIFVDVQNGLELEELHDVAITAVQNNDIIAYNASTTVWRNRQLFDSTAPAALAASATAGVSVTAARVDHVHARPTFDELTISGAAQGDILYRDSTSWTRLPAATAGYILQTNGTGANPGWVQNTGGSGAPTDAEYIVAASNGTLSAERVLGNSTSITANFGTSGQVTLERAALTGDVTASQNSNATTIANGVVSTAKMGGDVTTAGKALLDDADAAAQRTTLGLGTLATQSGTFSGTSSGTNTGDQTISLTGDVVGSGTGSFTATITVGAVNTSKLGGDITTAGKALLDDADASAQRTTLGLGTLATQSGMFSGTSSGTNTGDQTIQLTGDVTGSGTGSFAATIANGVVGTAKLGGDITTAGKALLDDADAAAQRTTLGLGSLATQSGTFSGTSSGTNTGDQTITLTGDVTGSGTGSFAATIANDAVTNAKLGNMAASTIKARVTGSTGDPEDATLTQVLDLVGSAAQGDILYRNASAWTRLGAGTSGHYLKTQGTGANPTWAAVSGGSSAQVDDYTSAGTYTWTKPTGAKAVQVICWGAGGGGGGGSGGATSTARCPGGGGGGGARIEAAHLADLVPSSVTVTVGAGGTAGTAGSSGSGGNGGAGGNSSFGGLVVAGGGGGGKQGIIATVSVGGGGGGVQAQGATGSGTGTVSGGGWIIQSVNPLYGSGLRGGDGRGQGQGYQAEWGGGGGAGGSAAPGGGPPGGGAVYGGGGGGAGGGINSSNSTQAGGSGGRSGLYNAGGGSNANAGVYPSGDGGDGGSSTVAGSNGGNPAGGGGGGGGGTTNGTAGGAGGSGRVVVITYF